MRAYRSLPPYPMSVRLGHDPAAEANQWMADATSEIKRLRAALREAMGWNWLDVESPPPEEVLTQCETALGRMTGKPE